MAKTQLGWANLLLARGEPSYLGRAAALLKQALDAARERGYALVERRALQALESVASV